MECKQKFRPNTDLKLMDQVREVLRYHHYAYRTEKTYCYWIRRYIYFYDCKVHPKEMDARNVERFLSNLAVNEHVSASTQKQAFNALIFLYNKVLDTPLKGIDPIRSKKSPRLPTVLTRYEVECLFKHIQGVHALMAMILYGSGLRLMECVRLRIGDVDFGRKRIRVLGKGSKWRTTILPNPLIPELQNQIDYARTLFHRDLEDGFGEVSLPEALARKYRNGARELHWQYVFPAKNRAIDPISGREKRHHVMESGLQKAVKRAAAAAQIPKHVTCHTLRHSFATTMLEDGVNIRILQEMMGHADVKTTERYTHVMDKDLSRLKSPLDGIRL